MFAIPVQRKNLRLGGVGGCFLDIFCHKLIFLILISVQPDDEDFFIFQSSNSVRSNSLSLKYIRFHHPVLKIKKLENLSL